MMIVYNVSIKVLVSVENKWLAWMKAEHLPAVMATKCFDSHRFYKLCEQEDPEGTTYVVQYFCESMEQYENYRTAYAPALQQETAKHFAGQFVAFRTLMQEV
jgi:hypothetical protein